MQPGTADHEIIGESHRGSTANSFAVAMLLALLLIAVDAVLIQTIVPAGSNLKNVMRAASLFIAVSAGLTRGARYPQWVLVVAGLLAILSIVRHNPDQLSYVFVLLLVPALRVLPERRLVRIMATASIASVALVFLLLGAGITHNEVLTFRSRTTFGTDGVPFFFNLVYGALTIWNLYARRYELRHRNFLLASSILVATALFVATDARGGYFCFLAFVAFLWLVPRLSEAPLFRGLVALLPVLLLVGTIALAEAGDSRFNTLSSNRLLIYRSFLDGLSVQQLLLSSSVKDNFATILQFATFQHQATSVDSSYLHLIGGGGIAITAVFFVLYARSVLRLFALGRHVDIAFLLATSLYFASESILVRIENVFVIYVWYLVLVYGGRPYTNQKVSRSASEVRMKVDAPKAPVRRPSPLTPSRPSG